MISSVGSGPDLDTTRGGQFWTPIRGQFCAPIDTSDGFDTEWQTVRAKAKVIGLTFHDLRGTAVTRLALAGCSEAEIATFTGHSLRDVAAILDAHYLSRDPRLADSALSKREAHEKRTNTPN